MRFWDSSALVPLLVEEEVTIALRDLYLGEPGTITWWGTPVECASAIARLEREERLSPPAVKEALQLVVAESWGGFSLPARQVRELLAEEDELLDA